MDRKTGDNPAERAFVVHFASDTDPDRNRYAGRVEHVSSGRVLRFEDLETLLKFLAATLRPRFTSAPPTGF